MCRKSYDPLIEGSPMTCPVCDTPVNSEGLAEHFYRHFVTEGLAVRDTGMTEAEYVALKKRVKGIK